MKLAYLFLFFAFISVPTMADDMTTDLNGQSLQDDAQTTIDDDDFLANFFIHDLGKCSLPGGKSISIKANDNFMKYHIANPITKLNAFYKLRYRMWWKKYTGVNSITTTEQVHIAVCYALYHDKNATRAINIQSIVAKPIKWVEVGQKLKLETAKCSNSEFSGSVSLTRVNDYIKVSSLINPPQDWNQTEFCTPF